MFKTIYYRHIESNIKITVNQHGSLESEKVPVPSILLRRYIQLFLRVHYFFCANPPLKGTIKLCSIHPVLCPPLRGSASCAPTDLYPKSPLFKNRGLKIHLKIYKSIQRTRNICFNTLKRVAHRPRLAFESRVCKTGGNRSGLTGYRSNRSGPVPVWAGTKPAQIQNSNLNSKNEKFPKNS